jgi:hypothetical protein
MEGWVQCSLVWLDLVEGDNSIIPFGMTAWDILERDFRKNFIDYAEHKRAQDQMQELKMKDRNVDQYIADFSHLGLRAGLSLDEPTVLRLFARGLPRPLAET